MILGYARTSTVDQLAGLAAQERDLRAAGADRVISEQGSAVKARAGLAECLGLLGGGDVLMVTKPDRLARSTAHLLTIVDDLNSRGIGLILLSLGGERVDTRNPTAKLILTIMGGIAAWERDIMLERQREGIAKARLDGKYVGRRSTLDHEQVRLLSEDGFGPYDIASRLGVSPPAVYRALKVMRE